MNKKQILIAACSLSFCMPLAKSEQVAFQNIEIDGIKHPFVIVKFQGDSIEYSIKGEKFTAPMESLPPNLQAAVQRLKSGASSESDPAFEDSGGPQEKPDLTNYVARMKLRDIKQAESLRLKEAKRALEAAKRELAKIENEPVLKSETGTHDIVKGADGKYRNHGTITSVSVDRMNKKRMNRLEAQKAVVQSLQAKLDQLKSENRLKQLLPDKDSD